MSGTCRIRPSEGKSRLFTRNQKSRPPYCLQRIIYSPRGTADRLTSTAGLRGATIRAEKNRAAIQQTHTGDTRLTTWRAFVFVTLSARINAKSVSQLAERYQHNSLLRRRSAVINRRFGVFRKSVGNLRIAVAREKISLVPPCRAKHVLLRARNYVINGREYPVA